MGDGHILTSKTSKPYEKVHRYVDKMLAILRLCLAILQMVTLCVLEEARPGENGQVLRPTFFGNFRFFCRRCPLLFRTKIVSQVAAQQFPLMSESGAHEREKLLLNLI